MFENLVVIVGDVEEVVDEDEVVGVNFCFLLCFWSVLVVFFDDGCGVFMYFGEVVEWYFFVVDFE